MRLLLEQGDDVLARHQAILLLGPTGTGKTPLGAMLQARGWPPLRCLHFDFGENLRQVVAQGQADEMVTADDVAFLRGVLATGALLEDRDFPIAARILRRFLRSAAPDEHTRIVLNGLPRHVGQAAAVDGLLDVRGVVHLSADAEVVRHRIRHDTGGDRAGRVDDDLESIRRKLAIYDQRTAPLVDFYRSRQLPILEISVSADMTPQRMWDQLLGRI